MTASPRNRSVPSCGISFGNTPCPQFSICTTVSPRVKSATAVSSDTLIVTRQPLWEYLKALTNALEMSKYRRLRAIRMGQPINSPACNCQSIWYLCSHRRAAFLIVSNKSTLPRAGSAKSRTTLVTSNAKRTRSLTSSIAAFNEPTDPSGERCFSARRFPSASAQGLDGRSKRMSKHVLEEHLLTRVGPIRNPAGESATNALDRLQTQDGRRSRLRLETHYRRIPTMQEK